jgi:hypothetical protein
LFTNRLLWLGASAGALSLRGSGCRNLALPGVYEQASPYSQLLPDLLFAELDAHIFDFVVPLERLPRRAVRGLGAPSPIDVVGSFFFWSVSSSSSAESFSSGNLLSASAPTKDRRLHHDLFGSGRGTSTLNLQIEF